MVSDGNGSRIVRVERRLGAATGEGVIYITEDGTEWRSQPNGSVACAGAYGRVTGGKFETRVERTGGR